MTAHHGEVVTFRVLPKEDVSFEQQTVNHLYSALRGLAAGRLQELTMIGLRALIQSP